MAVKDEEIQQVAANKQAQIDALHLEEIDQRDVGINQLQREIFNYQVKTLNYKHLTIVFKLRNKR